MNPLRVLLLTPAVPYPPSQGASLRNYYILKGLARHHDVALLSFIDQPLTDESLTHLQALCSSLKTIPIPDRPAADRLRDLILSPYPDMGHRLHAAPFFDALRELLKQPFDVVQLEGIELARALPLVRELQPQAKIIFDNHNAETELQRRAALTDLGHITRWPAALYSLIQVPKLRRFEKWICEQADAVTAVSQADAQLLETLAPGRRRPILPIPNTIDVHRYQQPPKEDDPRFDLIFTGKMDYRPNIDAMTWFLAEIWPAVRQNRPETSLAIVGQKPHPRVISAVRRAGPGVTLTGFVDAITPYIAGGRVVIMPLRMGSGTRLKLLEGMAAGKPVVSTTAGAEGYAVEDGRHLLLADSAADFSRQILRLLQDDALCATLGQAAQTFAANYDWRLVIPLFEALYAELCPPDPPA